MVPAMKTTRGGRRLASAAAACVLGLTVAACGGDDTGGSDSTESGGPLAEFFGWDEEARLGGDEEFTEEERQQHYEVQELVVACMSEAGFEYTPEQFYGDSDNAWEDPFAEVWKLQEDDPEAFARDYGYGYTTIDYDGIEESEPEVTDPNWEYQESLSPAAREEYEKALWGDWSEYEEAIEDGEEVEPIQPGGCSEAAYQEVYDYQDEEEESEQFEDLMTEWETLYERTENDPRLTEAKQAWSGCMADAGYPDLTDLYDAQDQVSQRQSELYGWDDEEAIAVESEGGSGGELTTQPDPSPSFEPVEPDPAELEELRTFEREIALADYQCRQEHDIDELERTVRFEHEAEFIEDHREELEAYRDWINERESAG
jgi:hypothetical protein